jgi:hypothetical protein
MTESSSRCLGPSLTKGGAAGLDLTPPGWCAGMGNGFDYERTRSGRVLRFQEDPRIGEHDLRGFDRSAQAILVVVISQCLRDLRNTASDGQASNCAIKGRKRPLRSVEARTFGDSDHG